MTLSFALLLAALIAVLAGLASWRWADNKADQALWRRLAPRQPAAPGMFDSTMIESLPEPARRFFRFAIAPGAVLYTVAELSMQGEFSPGAESKYMPMRADEILALPFGFVWRVRIGHLIRGSDAAGNGNSWSRFRVLGIVPVARAGNNQDHARATFGRYVAEAIFWTPAALLPGEHLRWEAIDDSSARVIVTHMGLEQAVDVFVDPDGRPTKVVFQRWTDANAAKVFQLQPFGGYLSGFKSFEGFTLPTRIEAGNFFETDDYFPFFKATVTSVRFPRRGAT